MILDIDKCARCGQAHAGLEFQSLYRTMNIGGHTFTHWCPCPTNQQPILAEIKMQPGPIPVRSRIRGDS